MRRSAFLAGRWYPADERSCRAAIEKHAAGARADLRFRGLIGPHAGWAYSGDCAGRTYAALGAHRRDAELVVVFGSHRGPHGPSTVFLGEGWETPLGALATDTELAVRLGRELALTEEPVRPARADNAVELHLPFARFFFPNARLLMIGVAAAEVALDIGRRVGDAVRERDAVFVGSTDLTHYGPDYGLTSEGDTERAVRWVRETNDAGFLAKVLDDDPSGALGHARANASACCPGAVAATLEAIRAHGGSSTPALVDHYLSYDVRPAASFVGYAGIVL